MLNPSLIVNNYLFQYELIYKYQKKNVFEIPKITSISIVLPLNQTDLIQKPNKFLLDKFLNFYFLFYLLFFRLSVLNIKLIKHKDLHINSYFLKFSVVKLKFINFFLFMFFNLYYFYYNNMLLENKDLIIKTKFPFLSYCNLKFINYSTKLLFFNIFDFLFSIEHLFNDVNTSEQFYFFINLKIQRSV